MTRKLVATIYQDDCPDSPRTWEPLGVMYCEHPRYKLSDKGAINPRTLEPEEIAIQLPLFLYDHSGLSMSTHSFIGRAQHAQWDSGQVGSIYLTVARLIAEYKEDTPETRAKATEVLKSEVEQYDQYLRGDVYGFRIEEVTTCECCGQEKRTVVESCNGFYGSNPEDNGMIDNAETEEGQDALREAYKHY